MTLLRNIRVWHYFRFGLGDNRVGIGELDIVKDVVPSTTPFDEIPDEDDDYDETDNSSYDSSNYRSKITI